MKVGVLVGRFQVPSPHEGHRFLLKRLQEEFDKLIVLIGSVNRARSVKNPYNFQYRRDRVLEVVPNATVLPLNDYAYSDSQWQTDVINTVNGKLAAWYQSDADIYFCGHWKEGNDYLNWFPQWKFHNVDSNIDISGTEVRNIHRNLLPTTVQNDLAYYEKEAKLFSNYPFPETLNFNCGDAILECNGHILLIERKFAPGAGTLALPGGFKNRNETFLDCAIRELLEETNIRVPEKVLRGSVVSTRLFDSPSRSNGIPRNTLAVHIRIKPDNGNSLPRANGGDDAQSTSWVSLHDVLNNCHLYDDHLDIISVMTNTNPIPAYLNPKYK